MNTELPDSTPADAGRADAAGNELLAAGLAVGAMGVAGVALGAVCPLCVVVTPALLGLGAVQKLRARLMAARARRELEPTPPGSAAT